MMKAAGLGLTDIVRLLINAGANPKLQTKSGKTALKYAEQFKSAEYGDLTQLLS